MLAQALSRRFASLEIHYGWAIVAVTFLVSLTTAGAMGLPGALILPLSREFGWNTEQISGALALRILLYGLMAPFAACADRALRSEARHSQRALADSLRAAARAGDDQVWQMLVLWGIVVGFGTGMTALVMSAIVSTRWFTERRGLVLGILTASNATGQLVFLPLGGMAREPLRLALGAGAVTDRDGRRRGRGVPVHGRSPRRRRAASLWRDRQALRRRPLDARVHHGASAYSAKSPAAATFWVLAGDLLHLRIEHQRPDPDPFHLALRGLRRALGHGRLDARRSSASATSSARSARAGCRIATTIARCCSSTTACADSRCSICRARRSASTACRCSRCSTASTGSRPCRRPCASPRSVLAAIAPASPSAGSSLRT